MTTFNELSHDQRPKGAGWRRLVQAVTVRGYINNNWHDVRAIEVNDETREVRVELPTVRDPGGVELTPHRVLTPDLYQAPPGWPS